MAELVGKAEVQDLSDKMDSLKREFAETARLAKDRTAAWVKDHPYASAGIIAGMAAGIGFAIGFMLGKRGD
jgi:ElaB/YqjD/DUF883 family membrane-anchored ribosome-binding protein